MHIIAHGAQINGAAAVHDQRLVATAEQVPEQLLPPARLRRLSEFIT
jgi:hypothetical protein